MPHFDFTINVPTLIGIFLILERAYRYLARMSYKIDTMWKQFLIDHPDYERRERNSLNIT